MHEHLNGFTARDKLLRSEYPRDKSEAPAFKELFSAAAMEHAEEDVKADEARRLKAIRELAAELKYLTLGDCRDRWQRIKDQLTKLNDLISGR